MMNIYVDADACPVIKIIEKIAKKYRLKVTLLCDTNHILQSDYSSVITVDAGADAVDLALINICQKDDIIVTQDYGVATLALGKSAYAIHHNGTIYTEDNIESMLMQRYMANKARRAKSKHHFKGPKKRTIDDDIKFENAFEKLIISLLK